MTVKTLSIHLETRVNGDIKNITDVVALDSASHEDRLHVLLACGSGISSALVPHS